MRRLSKHTTIYTAPKSTHKSRHITVLEPVQAKFQCDHLSLKRDIKYKLECDVNNFALLNHLLHYPGNDYIQGQLTVIMEQVKNAVSNRVISNDPE